MKNTQPLNSLVTKEKIHLKYFINFDFGFNDGTLKYFLKNKETLTCDLKKYNLDIQ